MTNRGARTLAIVTLALALPLVILIMVRSGDDSGSRSARAVSAPAGAPAPSGPAVIVPGRPGESANSVATEQAVEINCMRDILVS